MLYRSLPAENRRRVEHMEHALRRLDETITRFASLQRWQISEVQVEGVSAVHDLHVWSLTAERMALSAHGLIGGLESYPETLIRLRRCSRSATTSSK